jgi:predicted  nucleic acid-binding Zn-ribbon protein
LSNANDSIDILTSDLGLANDSISSLEAELDLSEENLSIANDSLTSLEFELSNIQSDISLLELQLDSTTNLLIEIQLELEASTYDINILSDSIVSLNDLITSLQEDLSIAISNQEDGIGQVDVDSAYNEGAAIGEEYGYNQGINDGYNQGYEEGESYGYVNGFEEGVASITPEDGISQEDVDAIQNLLDEANITISSLNTSLNLTSSSITELEQELLVAMSNQEDVDAIQNLLDDANNLISDLNNSLGLANANISDLEEQLSMALENQTEPILINLVEGWNIIGYTLNEPQDAVASLNDITSEIQIVKNNDAAVYWPEFGFNGIGDLIPGQGYQIKVLSNIFDFTYPNVEGQRIELTPTIPQWAIDMELDIHPNDIRTLVRVVNMLGQEVNPENQASGTVLLYLYNDATVEKKIK